MQKAFIKNLLDQAEADCTEYQKTPIPKNVSKTDFKPFTVMGEEISSEQLDQLKNGGYIFLENMNDGKGNKFSSFVFGAPDMSRPFFSSTRPDEFIRYGDYNMRIMDKMRIEAGFLVQAKVKWWGGIDYQYPYIWKEKPEDIDYQLSWWDPRIPKEEHKNESEPDFAPIKSKGRRV